jgi:nitrogen fixation NifU-like protein
MSLRDLYQEIIIDHGKQPRHFGKLMNANHCQVGHNPLCGDKLVLYIIEKNGILEDVRFEGVGCAISVASASLMIEAIKGKTLPEVHKLFEFFHHLVTKGGASEMNLSKLMVFSGVAEFPVRVKCATLAWHTLKAALRKDPQPISTE